MIKEETYNKITNVFATTIGVANIIGLKTKKQQIDEGGLKSFKLIEDDLIINSIICDAIEFGLYNELQRNVWHLKQKGSKRMKDVTIYRKAFKQATECAYSIPLSSLLLQQ